jgi:hypothetical protein
MLWRVDIPNILKELYEDRDRVDQAIAAMERLGATGQRRRGRPPKWLVEARKGVKSDSAGDAITKKSRRQSKRKPK